MNLALLVSLVLFGAEPRNVSSVSASRRAIDDRVAVVGTLAPPSLAVLFVYSNSNTPFGALLANSKGEFAGAFLTNPFGPKTALAIPVHMDGMMLGFGPPMPFTLP